MPLHLPNHSNGFKQSCIVFITKQVVRQVLLFIPRFLYARRSRFDPLWTTMLVAGVESDGAPFLGLVNHIGTAFTEECLATGLGADIAVPIMRDAIEKKGGADK